MPAAHGVEQLQTDYATGLRLSVTLSVLLLLIACANIANLLLARGSANRSQTAVRLALGAPRSRLIRQMLTESVLLAMVGGVAGLYVAYVGTRAILVLAFRGANYIPIDARPSLTVLGFSILLSLITGIVFGILPAWTASQYHPLDALRGAGRSAGDRSSVLQKPLAIAQVAFSIALLIAAGLVTQSLRNLLPPREIAKSFLANGMVGSGGGVELLAKTSKSSWRYPASPRGIAANWSQVHQGNRSASDATEVVVLPT